MGLEDFKTEGPRTRTKKKNKTSQVSDQVVHVLKGTDPDTSMLPSSVRTHEAVITESLKGITTTEMKDMCVCRKCKRTTGEFETMLKVDKLDFRNTSWYDEFMDTALSASDNVDREEVLGDFSLEARDEVEVEVEEEEDDEPEPTTGLESFKS